MFYLPKTLFQMYKLVVINHESSFLNTESDCKNYSTDTVEYPFCRIVNYRALFSGVSATPVATQIGPIVDGPAVPFLFVSFA